jgi:hypothetical protein
MTKQERVLPTQRVEVLDRIGAVLREALDRSLAPALEIAAQEGVVAAATPALEESLARLEAGLTRAEAVVDATDAVLAEAEEATHLWLVTAEQNARRLGEGGDRPV